MKKLKLFAFSLIAFLCFGVVSVNAGEVNVTDLDSYNTAKNTSNTSTVIKLGANIDISSLSTGGNQDAIYVNNNMVLDLNGYTITTQAAHIKLWYYGDYTVTIIDSLKTGVIFANGGGVYPIIEPININDSKTKLVLKNIKVESTDSLKHYMIFYQSPEKGTYDLEIDGTTFIKGNRVFERNNICAENSQINVNIKSMNTISMDQINQYGDYKVSDIIDTNITELVVNGSVIDPNTTISGYDISSGAVVRAKDGFSVNNVTFDTKQYGYSSVSAKPISIKTVGSTAKQVKTVTVSEPSKFTVTGSGEPTIAAGSTDNTTFTIKPVDGLAVGTHTAIITVTDMDDKTFTATVTFVVEKADIEPVVSISNWSYGSIANTPSVTGNTGNGTVTYEYKVKDSADSTYSATVPTEVGQYTIRAIVEETTNFKSGKNEKVFSINKGTYGEAIAYTKEVLEKKIAKYCILVIDLNLTPGFVNAYMVTFNDSGSYTNGVISQIGFEDDHAKLCIETGSVAANETSTFKLTISSKNYENKEATITVKTIAKEPITIDGLTYTSRDYNNTPIVPTGTLIHTGYTGTIDVLYEGTDGTIYNSTTAPTNVGKYKVTYSIPDTDPTYSGSKVYTFEIKIATPIYTIPTGLTGIVGDELSSVTLPSGFTWDEEDTVLVEGNQSYKGIYTPTDTNNYKTITDLNISVYVKNKYTISTDVNGSNGTISSSATVVEGTYYDVTFTPATGYMIDTVKVNGEQITVASNTYRITNITENKNVVVTYKKIPFTITVNEVTGATITPNGTINVLYGDNKEITITANLGYRLKSVKVNDEEKLPLTENKITLTNITEDQEVVVVVEKIEYDVTNGDGQKHIIGKNEDATFRIDADKDLFLKVYLNDEELDSAFYTITEGSTIITLKQDFLNNLLPNTYNLKVTFSDGGEATATFVIAQPKENNPKTGDPIMLSIILGSVSLIGLLGAGIYLKKKNA